MNIINIIKLVNNKKVSKIKPCYDMTGKRYVYCNGELISYRDIMRLKRIYQEVIFVVGMILIVAYAFIVKSMIG